MDHIKNSFSILGSIKSIFKHSNFKNISLYHSVPHTHIYTWRSSCYRVGFNPSYWLNCCLLPTHREYGVFIIKFSFYVKLAIEKPWRMHTSYSPNTKLPSPSLKAAPSQKILLEAVACINQPDTWSNPWRLCSAFPINR